MEGITIPRAAQWRRRTATTLAYLSIVTMLAYALLPILWMLSTALKPNDEVRTSDPTFVPTTLDWSHFDQVLTGSNFLLYARNSLIVASTVTLATLLVAMLAGYAVSRFQNRRLIRVAGYGLIIGQLVPTVLLIVPLYLTMQNLNLLGSFWSLILTYTTFTVPLSTLMLKSFFDQVPIEVEEAAEIDGCPAWQVVWRVVLPLAVPGLMTTALYAFVQAWNEFLFAYTFITDDERYLLTPGLSTFIGRWTVDWGGIMAAAFLGLLPVTFAYLYLQRYLISGLSTGATKG
jgi:multiple sugar transport system permease protein/raffinose/stachyose/melibiose transport system permease protein